MHDDSGCTTSWNFKDIRKESTPCWLAMLSWSANFSMERAMSAISAIGPAAGAVFHVTALSRTCNYTKHLRFSTCMCACLYFETRPSCQREQQEKRENILLLNTGPLSRTASPATHEKQANHWLSPQPPTQRRGSPANGSAWRSSWARLHKMAFEDRRINDTWCRKDATYLRMRSLDVGRLDGKSWYYASQN